MESIADQLGWSQATIRRIESGTRKVTPSEVSALLTLYRVTGEARNRLLELARDANRKSWLATDADGKPSQLATLERYESEAVRIAQVDLVLVSGLLRTPAYARAVMVGNAVPEAEIRSQLAWQLRRQQLLDREGAPEFVSYVDEAALRRRIGGCGVMAEQLRCLLKMAQQPNVSVRVIPFAQGGHPAVLGSFELMDVEAGPIAVVEHRSSRVFFGELDDVRPYVDAVASLDSVALDVAESARFIEHVLAGYEQM